MDQPNVHHYKSLLGPEVVAYFTSAVPDRKFRSRPAVEEQTTSYAQGVLPSAKKAHETHRVKKYLNRIGIVTLNWNDFSDKNSVEVETYGQNSYSTSYVGSNMFG